MRAKCQASPCDIVATVMPSSRWLDSFTCVEELVGRVDQTSSVDRGRADHQVELVELLPHRRGDHLAHGAGVFARRAQAGEDRIGIALVEREKLDRLVLVGLAVELG